MSSPWNLGYESLKIIGNCTIRYEFLLAFHSNYGSILYRLWDIGRKSRNFYIPPVTVFSAPQVVTPSEFRNDVLYS